MVAKNREKFFFGYLGRGIIWLTVILLIFILLKDSEYIKNIDWLTKLSAMEWLVYLIFALSEIVFGLIPPEFFMMWSLNSGATDSYVINVFLLSILSYGAGVLGYYIGLKFSKTRAFTRVLGSYMEKYKKPFRKFSGFVLFVGAVTPLPFSAMCMLVGTVSYPKSKFFIIILSRFLRFIVYGYVIWQVEGL